ncbi:MAG: hypothetical protein A3K19_04000 [Lentisphaerae bacterium RIFOXYB12_FULL_65_16]|nr:MAG: hypothetical protein A3K18_14170 [Lentisphaerae bacterium RIFOXYA12_64_32]OGV85242.1 MAG: hypothetical protein A3K19_04000 [Lentisphaerae bacterium RIFOXYB12_FULL_65_16]
MAFSLFPREVKFFELFQKQHALILDAAGQLDAVFGSRAAAVNACRTINRLEEEANILLLDIFLQMSRAFITPLDREDIHGLVLAQEDVMNAIRLVAARAGGYTFSTVPASAGELARDLKAQMANLGATLPLLDRRQQVETHLQAVRKAGAESAALLLVATGELYEKPLNSPADVLEIVKWTAVIDRLEQALEKVEALAKVIERISVKYA